MRITVIGELVICLSFFCHIPLSYSVAPSFWLFSVLIFFCSSKYFPEHKLPENVIATTDVKAALLGADFCFHAVPVQVIQIIFFCGTSFP